VTGTTNYSIIGTDSLRIRSSYIDQEFEISIALPLNYRRGTKERFPVIYLLDANLYFGMVTEMTRIMTKCREIPNTLIVGIGYPVSEPVNEAYDLVSAKRCRDYTPIVDKEVEKKVSNWCPTLTHCESGGAGDFLRFIKKELMPTIEKQYPIDTTDRSLLGHSWGGTFGLYALFHEGGFHKYAVCEADINYGDRVVFEYEKAYAGNHDHLSALLFYASTGERELLDIMKDRDYKELVIEYKSIQGLRHCEGAAPFIQAGIAALSR
jgi:predicted alpha/beta superfamily hydrolase